jgi:hypothetical protein
MRGVDFRSGGMSKPPLVMFSNIDKDTCKLIINDIHDKDCLELQYQFMTDK